MNTGMTMYHNQSKQIVKVSLPIMEKKIAKRQNYS